MRRVPLFLMLVIAVLSPACAEIGACPPGQKLVDGACRAPPEPCPPSITKKIPVGCAFLPVIEGTGEVGYLTYELTVKPGPIVSGGTFGAFFEGRALFGSDLVNWVEIVLAPLAPDGFRRVAVPKFQATVQVRQGAEGDDVVLKASPIPHTCTYDDNGMRDPQAVPRFPTCSPENDHDDGSNDDCIGLGRTPHPGNRCLPYVEIPTSDACGPGGKCWELGQTGPGSPCEENGFCVTEEGIEISLERGNGTYIADESGSVLFGWADRGIPLLEDGPNRGAYDPSQMRPFSYGFGLGPSGFRMLIAGIPFAFECLMGVNSRDPDGVPTVDPLLSRSPDSVLISCPIQEPE